MSQETDQKIDGIADKLDKLTREVEKIGRQVADIAEKMLAPMEDPSTLAR